MVKSRDWHRHWQTDAKEGNGKSFFGEASKEVFCFRSGLLTEHDHPHDSDAKRGFRKMKMELANSLSHLRADQDSSSSSSSTTRRSRCRPNGCVGVPENQQHFLGWVDEVPAFGILNQPAALAMALRMRPDVIYFLTNAALAAPPTTSSKAASVSDDDPHVRVRHIAHRETASRAGVDPPEEDERRDDEAGRVTYRECESSSRLSK